MVVFGHHSLWQALDPQRLKGKRGRALARIAARLWVEEARSRGFEVGSSPAAHWAIVDLVGKGGHVRTVAVSDWGEKRGGRLARCGQMEPSSGAISTRVKLDDVLGVQQEVAREVSQKLRLRLSGIQQTEISKRTTENIEARQLYLKGRYFWKKSTEDAFLQAIKYLSQAVEKYPRYALAYAGLADCYLVQGWIGRLPPKEI